jgi:hypothetical protein
MKVYILYQGPYHGAATFQTDIEKETVEAALECFKQYFPLATMVDHRQDKKYTDKEIYKIKMSQFQLVNFKTIRP